MGVVQLVVIVSFKTVSVYVFQDGVSLSEEALECSIKTESLFQRKHWSAQVNGWRLYSSQVQAQVTFWSHLLGLIKSQKKSSSRFNIQVQGSGSS